MYRKLVGLLTVIVTGLVFSSVASAGVVGSVHDFTAEIGTVVEVCGVCHTPHAADRVTLPGGEAPLWDHDLTNLASFTPYSSATMGSTMPNAATGISRCHWTGARYTVTDQCHKGRQACTCLSLQRSQRCRQNLCCSNPC